jgi:hypothetical protein
VKRPPTKARATQAIFFASIPNILYHPFSNTTQPFSKINPAKRDLPHLKANSFAEISKPPCVKFKEKRPFGAKLMYFQKKVY